jgi:DNA-binding MarR family transcriptional regulator
MKIDLTKYKPFKGLLSIEEYSILTIIDNYCEISKNGYYHQPASFISEQIGYTPQMNNKRIKDLIDKGYLISRSKKGYKTRKMLKPSSKYFKTKENEST